MRVLHKTVFLLTVALVLLAELGCGDYYRPVANPIISPGGQPQHTHWAWVLNANPANSGSGIGSVTEIDVSGDSTLSVNSMGAGTSTEAFPTNSLSLYVANKAGDTVMQFLPTLSGAITTISLLPGSHPVALNSANNAFMYVLNSGANSACPNTGSISTIVTSTLSVSNTVCVGTNPTAMVQSPIDGFVYVINQGDNTVSVFDPSTASIYATISTQSNPPLGMNPVAITTNAQGWVFVITQGDHTTPGTLDIIQSGLGRITATAPLGVQPTFAYVDPNRNRLYVTNNGDDTVSVFDASAVNPSGTPQIPLLGTAHVGTGPIGVTALQDGSNFYVANAGSNNVTIVSQSSFSPLGTVTLPSGANPVWIASDPTSQKVYVADSGISQTTIIQTSNNTISQNILSPTQVSGCPSSCALQTPVMILTQ